MALEPRNDKRKRAGGGNIGEELAVGASAGDQLEHRLSIISQSDSSTDEKVNEIVSAVAFTHARLETEQKQYGKTFVSAIVAAVFVLAGVTAEQLRGTLTKHEHKQNQIVLNSSDPVVHQILVALESVEMQLKEQGVTLTDPKRREIKNALVCMALSMAKANHVRVPIRRSVVRVDSGPERSAPQRGEPTTPLFAVEATEHHERPVQRDLLPLSLLPLDVSRAPFAAALSLSVWQGVKRTLPAEWPAPTRPA